MELIVFGAIALGVVYVLYKAYGPKQESTVSVADVVAKAESVVVEAEAKTEIALDKKPAKKTAAKKSTVKKATTRKPKAAK